MAISLEDLLHGDTDYILKFNTNFAAIEAAINSLQAASQGSSSQSIGQFIAAIFGGVTTRIGVASYVPTPSGTNVNMSAGGAYHASSGTVVQGPATVVAFAGQGAGTYYIDLDSIGLTTRTTVQGPNTLVSVTWTGSAVSAVSQLTKAMFTASEEGDGRTSTAFAATYPSLDARLESTETAVVGNAADIADLLGSTALPIRKVGVSLDNTTGLKGAIQLDFAGTIIGWSVIANTVGDLTVEVSRAHSSPPPSAPVIPNPTTGKISASAPITLTAAQSAASGTAGVGSWSKDVIPWDVLQFSVTAVSALTRATLYLRIQEVALTSP